MNVYKVEISTSELRNIFLSEECAEALASICESKAAEVDSKARSYLHAPVNAPLFKSKVIREPNTYIGIVHGIGLRTKNGVKPIAQQIDAKHHVMTW